MLLCFICAGDQTALIARGVDVALKLMGLMEDGPLRLLSQLCALCQAAQSLGLSCGQIFGRDLGDQRG